MPNEEKLLDRELGRADAEEKQKMCVTNKEKTSLNK